METTARSFLRHEYVIIDAAYFELAPQERESESEYGGGNYELPATLSHQLKHIGKSRDLVIPTRAGRLPGLGHIFLLRRLARRTIPLPVSAFAPRRVSRRMAVCVCGCPQNVAVRTESSFTHATTRLPLSVGLGGAAPRLLQGQHHHADSNNATLPRHAQALFARLDLVGSDCAPLLSQLVAYV